MPQPPIAKLHEGAWNVSEVTGEDQEIFWYALRHNYSWCADGVAKDAPGLFKGLGHDQLTVIKNRPLLCHPDYLAARLLTLALPIGSRLQDTEREPYGNSKLPPPILIHPGELPSVTEMRDLPDCWLGKGLPLRYQGIGYIGLKLDTADREFVVGVLDPETGNGICTTVDIPRLRAARAKMPTD